MPLAGTWSGQFRRGRSTRAATVRAPSWVIEDSTPRSRLLRGTGTVRHLDSGQMLALHAHLVQRCVSLRVRVVSCRERVLFIGTRYSNLYTAVDTPA